MEREVHAMTDKKYNDNADTVLVTTFSTLVNSYTSTNFNPQYGKKKHNFGEVDFTKLL